jgi:hypothetical protein
MKFRIEAVRETYLSMVVEAADGTSAVEAAMLASADTWDGSEEGGEIDMENVRAIPTDEEAFWRVTVDGELEPYEDPTVGQAGGVA